MEVFFQEETSHGAQFQVNYITIFFELEKESSKSIRGMEWNGMQNYFDR